MKAFSPTPVAYAVFLLIATAVACDTGSGVERAVTGAVQDRTILPPADAVAAGVLRHHDEVLAGLRAKLGLSAEQSARVQEIFAAHQGAIEAAWAEAHANLRRGMQEATTEMEAVLDSTQIERLHAWLAERHGRAADHAPGRGHSHANAVAAGAPRHHDEVLTELRAKLSLSANQSARVREIFARHHAEREAARAQVHANLQRALQEATAEIETVLDSTQIKRLHAWLAERHGPTSRHAPGQPH